VTAEKVYESKKNAYRQYIREIYTRINEELKKKNTFLTVAHTGRHVDCSLSLTAKELRPPHHTDGKERSAALLKEKSERLERERVERGEEGELRRKLAVEKVRL
jgi:hypothetical protein